MGLKLEHFATSLPGPLPQGKRGYKGFLNWVDAREPIRFGLGRMIRRINILGLFLFLALPLQAAEPKMTLEECYGAAVVYSERVAISREEINLAKARFTQVLGEILPKINLVAQESLQDPAAQTTGGDSNVQSTLTRLSRPEIRVNFFQPLFRGFQEFQALKITKLDRREKELLLKDAERLLFQDVAVAFFTIALVESEIKTTEQIISVSRSQVGAIQKRVELGKSRESEGSEQAADLALLEAELEKQRGQKTVAYEMLSFLTGLVPQPPIRVVRVEQIPDPSLPEFVAHAENRVDVQAARDNAAIAQRETKIRQGELLPRVDAEANVYALRVGFVKEIDWDAEIRLTQPLFNGTTIGRIQEAKANARIANFQAEERRRIAVHETRQNFDSFTSSVRQFLKFQNAARLSEKSYRLQSQDFRLGLLNNFDLLQSQRLWFSALRQRDTAAAQAWVDWYKLQTSAGVLP